MSIRYSYPIYFSALLVLLAACTQDELTDDTRLPEGQYPLQIAAVTLSVEGGEAQPWGAPQTRVSENGDGTGSVWDWNGTEMIGVQLGGETTTYTLNADKTLSTNDPLYWQNTQTATVTAWYPATDGTLNLSDQTNGLAYLLHGTGRGDYQTPVTLTFTHSLAKVRVTPSDAIGDGEVTSLQLYTYTQCTHNQGNDVQGTQEGWIEMKECEYNGQTCWEANVVPDYAITKLIANNDGKERELSAPINPKAGSFYNITLNKDKGYTVSDDGKTYTVYTADGLLAWNDAAQIDLTLNCTLTADINMTGKEWTPIGSGFSSNTSYQGTFDGQGHRITGLTITTNSAGGQNATLFDYIGSDGTVKNLQVEVNYNVQQNGASGGIAWSNYGTITACSVTGNITANSGAIGGIAVNNFHTGTITACWFDGDLTTTYDNGGIAAYNYGTITACFYGGNAGYGANNQGGTVDATKVNDGDSWQTAVDGMNNALTGNDYQWTSGTDGLPVLKKK